MQSTIRSAKRKCSNRPSPTIAGRCGDDAVRAVFRELISGTRALQTPIRVAYLGPEFTFSHLAAIERFGQSAELVPVGTIAAVFEEVERGQAEFGVVPMENSTDGRVSDTLDCFSRSPVRICGELPLRIHHCLLGVGTRDEVRTVYSKPQPLSQCRNWLAKHLPKPTLREVASTAEAAQLAKDEPDVGGRRQRAGRRQLRPAGAGRRISKTTRTTSRASPIIATTTAAAHRQRQDGPDARNRPPAGRAGRRDGHLQAQPAQHDLDRVVSDPRPAAAAICSSSSSSATRASCEPAGRSPRWRKRPSGSKFSAPMRRPSRSGRLVESDVEWVEFGETHHCLIMHLAGLVDSTHPTTLDSRPLMRRKLIAGNWKMNTDRAGAVALAAAVVEARR